MRNKIDELIIRAKNKATVGMNKKDKGVAGLIVTALLCVIAVGLTALFRTESGNLINTIFDTTETNITNTLIKEFVPGA